MSVPANAQGERGQATETSPLSVRAVRTFGECQQPELPAQPERGTCQSQDRAANHDRSRPLGTFLCGPTLCGGCRSRHMWSKLSRWLTISPCLLELRGRLSGGIRAHLHTAARHGLHICPLVGCLLRGGNLFHPEKGFLKHAGNVSQMSPENHCKQVCAFVLEKHLFKVNVYYYERKVIYYKCIISSMHWVTWNSIKKKNPAKQKEKQSNNGVGEIQKTFFLFRPQNFCGRPWLQAWRAKVNVLRLSEFIRSTDQTEGKCFYLFLCLLCPLKTAKFYNSAQHQQTRWLW